MQSKFWGDDSDDSYSDSSEYSSKSDEKDTKRTTETNKWTVDSSDDDGESRVVKTAKAKALETIQTHIKTIEHLKKINDYSELLKDYDILAKLIDKQYSSSRLPKLIVKLIIELGQFMDSQQKDKESYKKLSKAKTISFNTLRSRLRKFNEQHSDIIEEYNKDPDGFYDILEQSEQNTETSVSSYSDWSEDDEEEDDVDDDELDEDEDEQDDEKKLEKKSKKDKQDIKESISDLDKSPLSGETSGWSDSGSQTSSDVEDVDKHSSAMVKWGVKKTETRIESIEKPKKPKQKLPRKKEILEKQPQITNIGRFTAVISASDALYEYFKLNKLGNDDNPFNIDLPEIQHMVNTVYLNEESLKQYLRSIIEKRGKRGINNNENLKVLHVLPYIAKKLSHTLYLEVVETLIHLQFDTYSHAYGSMTPNEWINTYRIASHLVSELVNNPKSYLLSENLNNITYTDKESVDENTLININTGEITEKIKTSLTILSSIVQKLNDELYKGLLHTEVYNPDYKTMLGYTIDMLYMLHKTLIYYLQFDKKGNEFAATTAMNILEHCYYKEDGISNKIWEMVKNKINNKKQLEKFFINENKKPSDLIVELVNFVFIYGTQREKMKACLHLAYNKSLHGYYYEARDLLLVSNLSEIAIETDINTQILVNRNLAMLGICAFRIGLIYEAHSYLMDMCIQSKHKELLAQGLSNIKNIEKTPEQERAERRRLLPYHMHISIDLIESVNFISALLLESANYAKSSLKGKEIASRQFRRMYEMYEKQVFVGPPESNREVILVAFKYLQNGDWKKCFDYLISLNTWNNMPDKDKVQNTLKKLVKIEGFRTYVFKYANIYDSFSVDQLSSMFDLEENIVHSLISKMIVNGEIHGSWDFSSKCCLLNHTEPTELQKLAIKLAENLSTAVEQNELTLNMKNSKFALSQDRKYERKDTRYYAPRHEDGRMSTFNFNRNRKIVQGQRPNSNRQYPVATR